MSDAPPPITTTLTAEGVRLIQAAGTGTPFEITRIEMGSGDGETSPYDMTALVETQVLLPIIGHGTREDGVIVVRGTLLQQTLAAGFWYREAGVYAQQPGEEAVLIAYVMRPLAQQVWIPPASAIGDGGEALDQTFEFSVIVGNAGEALTVRIDDNLLWVTQAERERDLWAAAALAASQAAAHLTLTDHVRAHTGAYPGGPQ